MSDLTDEMRQLAADAATHARPMAVAERHPPRQPPPHPDDRAALDRRPVRRRPRRGRAVHRRDPSPSQQSGGGLRRGRQRRDRDRDPIVGQRATLLAGQVPDSADQEDQGPVGGLLGRLQESAEEALHSCRRLRTWPEPAASPRHDRVRRRPAPLSSPHHFSGSLSAKIISNANKTSALGKNGSVSLSVESVTKSAADQH